MARPPDQGLGDAGSIEAVAVVNTEGEEITEGEGVITETIGTMIGDHLLPAVIMTEDMIVTTSTIGTIMVHQDTGIMSLVTMTTTIEIGILAIITIGRGTGTMRIGTEERIGIETTGIGSLIGMTDPPGITTRGTGTMTDMKDIHHRITIQAAVGGPLPLGPHPHGDQIIKEAVTEESSVSHFIFVYFSSQFHILNKIVLGAVFSFFLLNSIM